MLCSLELIPFPLRYWYSSVEADVLKNDSFTSLIYSLLRQILQNIFACKFSWQGNDPWWCQIHTTANPPSPGFLWWIDVRRMGATKGWDGSSRGHILHLYIWFDMQDHFLKPGCFLFFGVTMFLVFYIQYISIYDTVYIYISCIHMIFTFVLIIICSCRLSVLMSGT